jgi:hypothetical protein
MQHPARVNGRTLEHKFGAERVLGPVHLATNDGEEGLGVDENPNIVLDDHLVEGAWLVDILEVIRHARASFVANANADELGFRLLEQAS